MFTQEINKYGCSFSIINMDSGETLERKDCLQAVAIKNDYENNVYPLFVLSLSLTESDREYIVKNNVCFSVTMNKYKVDDNTDSSSDMTSESPNYTGTVFTDLLKPFNKALVVKTSNADDNSADSDSAKTNTEKTHVSYELNCISYNNLKYNETIVNESFANANVNEVCVDILSDIYTGDIYYQESNNTTRYDALLIPPLNLIPALRYLNTYYAVYTNSMNIFFDSNKLYVYDIQDNSRTFDNTLLINVVASSDNSNKNIYNGVQMDENGDLQMYLSADPDSTNEYDLYRDTIGKRSVFSSYDNEFNLITRDYTNDGDTNKTRYFWNNMQNSVYENRAMSAFYKDIRVALTNFDPSLVTPATFITLSGSSADLDGDYALKSSVVVYTTTDFSNYTSSETLFLGKYN